MRAPALAATIERRLLVNYRADPAVAARLLPASFRPQLVGGMAMVGVCLIRLGHVRPVGAPRWIGLRSENAAHRIAVEWDTPEGPMTGVYIPMRHSESMLTTVAGGRIFPGAHRRADFAVREADADLCVAFRSRSGETVEVRARSATTLGGELFDDVDDASAFFRAASTGFSPRRNGGLDGVELVSDTWHMEPVELTHAASSFLDDPTAFPPGSIELDDALVMRDLDVRWQPAGPGDLGRADPAVGSLTHAR